MSGMTSIGNRKMSFFRALRELRRPVSVLAVMMLVLNVSFVGGVSLANAGPGSITLITCLNPDRGATDTSEDGDLERHDCISCCLSTAKALAAPTVPTFVVGFGFAITNLPLPDDARPDGPSGHPASPIRAPPVLS